ncbi:MAG: Two component transcriptional regulator, LuxR family [uncultured Thiotrichaceae bacterium]|uniref:Two component transcriptional regulator, LuxR family n=1 Tax=uncultured Thiotrichaceae bacterium TaxID=298394 RepID=A0A6S6U1N8_9GAMM|nr:MAG: Two component transcriptional regulator, LuxR family [uncultured Thiotrichaceae bacterium]
MKLLIVEDEQFTREGQIALLKAMYGDIDIVEAFSMEQASNVPDKNSFDYIFLDYTLPDSRGIDSLLSVKEMFVASKIIVVSSDDTPSMIRIAIDNAAHGYLPKKYQGDKLIDTLRMLLNGTSFFPTSAVIDKIKTDRENEVNRKILKRLTPRQKEVLQCLFDAKVDKIIADELDIKIGTVRRHNYDIYKAFSVSNRSKLLAYLKDSEFWQQEIKRLKRGKL